MKLFLDSANLDEIEKALPWRIVDGVTTNPSLLAREAVPGEGVSGKDRILQICHLVSGDVSAPLVTDTVTDMLAEARQLARLHSSVVVKVPMTPDGITVVAKLASEGIRTNVTLCFSAAQALLAAKAGAYIVSPFVGRLDDLGWPGLELIRDIATIYKTHAIHTQILAASLRSSLQVIEVAKAGAHIATVTLKVLEQMFYHPLTAQGMQQFLDDHRKAVHLEAELSKL